MPEYSVHPPVESAEHPARLGILLVHGIGTQRRGETLSAFGGAIYAWIDDRLRGVDIAWRRRHTGPDDDPSSIFLEWRGRVESWAADGFPVGAEENLGIPEAIDSALVEHKLPSTPADAPHASTLVADGGKPTKGESQIPANRQRRDSLFGTDRILTARADLAQVVLDDPNDPSAPAHARLRMRHLDEDGVLEEEQWLLAESWWAESFSPPTYGELARWTLRAVPWTIGSHFGARVQRVWRGDGADEERKGLERGVRRFGHIVRLVVAGAGLTLALLFSPLLLALLFAILLLGLLPIPQIRAGLLQLQLLLSATLGDSYMLVSRPVEAAAIVSRVRRDLAWLSRRASVVAVVAHSQGGAVSQKALLEDPPENVRLLFTFGSGLKKLSQLEQLLSEGKSFRRSALFTLIALPIFLSTLLWFVIAFRQGILEPDDFEAGYALLSVLAFFLLSAGFLVAGVRDFVRGLPVPALNRWVARLSTAPFRWMDAYATADPVSNGPLREDEPVRSQSVEVCNLASATKDHTTYWDNRDEFVTRLMSALAGPTLHGEAETGDVLLSTPAARMEWLSRRRRWRVAIRTAMTWTALVSVLVAARNSSDAWWAFLDHVLHRFWGWAAPLVGLPPRPTTAYVVSWDAVGPLLGIAAMWGVALALWRRWNVQEMHDLVQGREVPLDIPTVVALVIQMELCCGLIYGAYPPYGLFIVVFLVPIFLIAWTMPRASNPTAIPVGGRERRSTEGLRSQSDRLYDSLRGVVERMLAAFVVVYFGWRVLAWVLVRLGVVSDGGGWLNSVPAVLVGVGVALLYLLYRWFRRRRGLRLTETG